jgi:hypothetical protein
MVESGDRINRKLRSSAMKATAASEYCVGPNQCVLLSAWALKRALELRVLIRRPACGPMRQMTRLSTGEESILS